MFIILYATYKDFKLKEPVTEIFQIKYFRQALFQKYSNMIDLSDFISDNDIYKKNY